MFYPIKDGKIQNIGCEINAVMHCNLSCRACAHFSPVAKPYFFDPEQLFKELSLLEKYYHVGHIRLIGGEPLLHPQISDLIDASIKSGITECVRIVTNGILLWKMDDLFWKKINEIHVTVYPGKEMSKEHLELCLEKSKKYNVEMQITEVNHFRECFSEIPSEDENLTKRIYDNCAIAHTLRSHSFHEGYLYKCPQALFLPMFLKNNDFTHLTIDGIKVEEREDFIEDLITYLESPEPLVSCKYCPGCTGKHFPMEQLKRKNWWISNKKPLKEIINMEDLKALEFIKKMIGHIKFIEVAIKKSCNENFHPSLFGQLFYFEGQEIAIISILLTIESAYSVNFSHIVPVIMNYELR
jgi:organic radical activating enzyme